MPSYERVDRISEEIRREVDKIIREDVRDPRIAGTYSIVRAEATRDLRYCKVYLSVLGQVDEKELKKGLKSCSGWLRHELGSSLSLRYTPELIFELDHSIERGAHISRLLEELEPSGAAEQEEE